MGVGDIDALPFVPAAHRAARRNGAPNLIVVHDGETNEGPTAAEGMAAYFASGNTTGSAHICVDDNSGVRCAGDGERTNGAGGVNDSPDARALHIEQAGRAGQSASEWDDAYSRAVVENCADVLAQWTSLDKYPHIRRVFLTAAQLRAGERDGITTHREVTAAGFAGNDGHSDPGPNYPLDRLMALVVGVAPAPPPPPPEGEITMGKLVTFQLGGHSGQIHTINVNDAGDVVHTFAGTGGGQVTEVIGKGATPNGDLSIERDFAVAGRLDVFAEAADGKLVHAWYQPVAAPAVAKWVAEPWG